MYSQNATTTKTLQDAVGFINNVLLLFSNFVKIVFPSLKKKDAIFIFNDEMNSVISEVQVLLLVHLLAYHKFLPKLAFLI